MSTTQKGGNRVGPDATQIMLQKNDRIREKYVKRMKTLGKEEERCTEDRTRQVSMQSLISYIFTNNEKL